MTFKTEPQGQMFTHIKETYICCQHINYEKNESSTEEKKPKCAEKHCEEGNGCGGHLVFRNEPKNISWQGLLIVNIPCKFEKPNWKIAAGKVVRKKAFFKT